ncbi:hypothetical protein [Zhihengliuella salsuginis]|uniref:WXG100 family type VII secretion target n=1 Tax=Zhihengliuella salsuginis TaxID=578222 RepID=A0ABQ3GFR9_9MICC|nr:hypothetical protein [Zhihengliuella salsuginis]GHD04247.1 hypothetical protein GCM10008096_11340 [Zhihengliuella salsuginis]
MGLNTECLKNWPNPDTLRADAGTLKTKGNKVHEAVGDCATEWAPVADQYRSGEGRDQIVQAMTLPLAHGAAVSVASERINGHLATFCDTIVDLEERRTSLNSRIGDFNSNESSTDEDKSNPSTGYGSQSEIQGKIDALGQDLIAAADKCAKDINSVDVTSPGFVEAITSKEVGITAGLLGAGLTLTQFKDVEFTRVTVVRTTFQQWKLTAIQIPTRTIVTPNGRYISTVTLVQAQVRTLTTETITAMTWTQRQLLNLRPEVNEFLYKQSQTYRDLIDRYPDRWAPMTPGSRPAWWRPDQKLMNTVDDFMDAKGWTKFAKGAGPVMTLVTAGMTYADEYSDAKEELLKDHPDWTEEQIHNRALYEATLKGTTKVGLDIAAGMTGAAIGTAIGGPVGTVVGFAVGIGISYVLDATGAKDWAADTVTDIADGVGDIAEDVGGAVSDAWNSIF